MTILKRNLPFYLAMAFQTFPVYYLVTGAYSSANWGMLLVFNLAYFYLIHRSKAIAWRDNLALALMMGLIALMSLIWSPSMFMFVFYVTNIFIWILGEGVRDRRFQLFLLSCLLLYFLIMVQPNNLESKLSTTAISIFTFGFSLYMANIIEKERLEAERLAHHESINLLMAENERNRIGQDLHDSLGHVFATMSVKTELASMLLENGAVEAAQKELGDLQILTQESMKEVRSIVEGLKAHSLQEEMKIISNLLDLADVDLEVNGLEETHILTTSQSAALSMVLRELVNNLLKHSRAKACRLHFSRQGNKLTLRYEDDGIGFEQVTGQELHSVRERMSRQAGTVEILSPVGPTVIVVSLPVEDEK